MYITDIIKKTNFKNFSVVETGFTTLALKSHKETPKHPVANKYNAIDLKTCKNSTIFHFSSNIIL
jgi:hypothetical protein